MLFTRPQFSYKPYSIGLIVCTISFLFCFFFFLANSLLHSQPIPVLLGCPSPGTDRGRMTARDQPRHTSGSSTAPLGCPRLPSATPRHVIGQRAVTPPISSRYSGHAPICCHPLRSKMMKKKKEKKRNLRPVRSCLFTIQMVPSREKTGMPNPPSF